MKDDPNLLYQFQALFRYSSYPIEAVHLNRLKLSHFFDPTQIFPKRGFLHLHLVKFLGVDCHCFKPISLYLTIIWAFKIKNCLTFLSTISTPNFSLIQIFLTHLYYSNFLIEETDPRFLPSQTLPFYLLLSDWLINSLFLINSIHPLN